MQITPENNMEYLIFEDSARDAIMFINLRARMLTDIVHEGRIEKRWTVKAQVVFCMNCPAYVSERDIAFVAAFQFLKGE